jgi:hypothetical protein
MAYGTVKVDNITFDNGGSDQNVTVSGLYRATTSGVTVSGTIAAGTVSGVTVIGSTTVSGATVTGTTANFTSGNFGNLISAAATMTGALVMDNQQQVRFRETTANGTNFIAIEAPASVTADRTLTLPDVTGTIVSTGDTGSVTSTMILDGTILNADINASAAIVDTKLDTIATAGKVSNSATTAASANTPSAIVARDGSGNFTAGTITANLTGTASNVTTNANLTGDVTSVGNATAIAAGVIVNADINASAAIVDTKLDTIATAGKVSNSATTATDANTASAIVARSAAGNFNITSINNGPLAGMRNAIINGNFDIWQRGTSFTGAEYGADRWNSSRSVTTHTATRQAFTLGQTDVPGEPAYYCRTVVSSVAGVSNFSVLGQFIESVKSFAGQQITLSFWAKADATKNIAIEFTQNFGTGGSPSAEVSAIGVVKKTLTTSWQKITHTVTITSISGKTLGSNNNDMLRLYIWFDAGSDYNARTDSLGQQSGTFEIAQVQVEPGPVDTPFERRPIGTELALCQRYFCKSYNQSVDPGAITTAGVLRLKTFGGGNSSSSVEAFYPVVMRDTPSITVFSPDTGTSGQCRRDNVDQAAAAQAIGDYKAVINTNSTNTDSEMRAHFTASAEL